MELEALPLLQDRRDDDDVSYFSSAECHSSSSTHQQTSGLSGDIYSSLPILRGSRSIRVLDIEAPNHGSPSPICGNLRVVLLNECLRFTALSYVWGVFTSPPQTISCGGYAIPVSSNCWSALWHLRERLGQVTIWIDAICISQDDIKEKEDQIPLMGDIYSLAMTVYIWMGESTPESDEAIEYLSTAGFQQHMGTLDSSQGRAAHWKIALRMFTNNERYLFRHLRTYGTFTLNLNLLQSSTGVGLNKTTC